MKAGGPPDRIQKLHFLRNKMQVSFPGTICAAICTILSGCLEGMAKMHLSLGVPPVFGRKWAPILTPELVTRDCLLKQVVLES